MEISSNPGFFLLLQDDAAHEAQRPRKSRPAAEECSPRVIIIRIMQPLARSQPLCLNNQRIRSFEESDSLMEAYYRKRLKKGRNERDGEKWSSARLTNEWTTKNERALSAKRSKFVCCPAGRLHSPADHLQGRQPAIGQSCRAWQHFLLEVQRTIMILNIYWGALLSGQ